MSDAARPDETGEGFQETAWSVVLAANAATEARADAALAQLCHDYWRPIYSYLRRSGRNNHDAQDLTQSFFEHLLANETLRRASPERGRFRSFLLGALKLCLADEYSHRHALKRGGDARFIPVDELVSEELHHQARSTELSPDETLDVRWAGVVLERALEKVRLEFCAEGKGEMFGVLSPFLAGEKPDISYQELAGRINLSLGAVKTHIHRLRQQFANAVRYEVMQTVSAPHEVEQELRQLRGVFARGSKQRAS